MAASDNLSPHQFAGKADKSDSDKDKALEYDVMGQDEDAEFGYSDYDAGDYQWDRHKSGKPEVY